MKPHLIESEKVFNLNKGYNYIDTYLGNPLVDFIKCERDLILILNEYECHLHKGINYIGRLNIIYDCDIKSYLDVKNMITLRENDIDDCDIKSYLNFNGMPKGIYGFTPLTIITNEKCNVIFCGHNIVIGEEWNGDPFLKYNT